ncbi:NAD(P)/FAD-dependent oxidoreductase [Nocardia asteroides]|uniref:NAD(P)/FAD-dependent oxidoreductase n=1 Tax=Nocardia asteroides TaxID=1824 RepID=UPI001E3DEA04|nr:FAD-dependent oxidoreductase [Nocardia asteroides]UGT62682.1 FAD-dependent oxidoreductase [Nocardia asteroides]
MIVVIGGGIAGVSTVAALRSGGYEGDLTLVEAGALPYDRPPLSKEFLLGTKAVADIALRPPEWYDDSKIRLFTGTRATALHPGTGRVELGDGTELPAEHVVLATGGAAARPPVPGLDGDRVHVLRTDDDAERLRTALRPGARVLVVGAGLIGAEVASTAVDLGCEVVLADPTDPPLAAALGTEVARWLHDRHAPRGIRTVTAAVGAIRRTGHEVEVEIPEPQRFDLVVLGIGMVPDTALAAHAGIEVERGIVVDPARRTSNPAVLAVGDPARVRRAGVLLPRTEHWDAARHDGAVAAATLLGTVPPAEPAPWFWTDRHGLHVEAIGGMTGAERTVLRGSYDSSAFAVFALVDGRVAGAVAVNDSTAVRAARRLIERGTAVDPDRLADPRTELRALLRG